MRLEKLDRGMGKLGVQITRTKVQSNEAKPNMKTLRGGNLVLKTKVPNAGLLFVSNRMTKPENINFLKNLFLLPQ